MPKSTGVRAARRAATISRILAAAREEFARNGPAATVRSIARRAHVDPSLVMQYFTSKDALFIAATAVSEGQSEQHLRDVLAAKDVDKAIADRAEWRADERRWCRQGVLPQPGWWSEVRISATDAQDTVSSTAGI